MEVQFFQAHLVFYVSESLHHVSFIAWREALTTQKKIQEEGIREGEDKEKYYTEGKQQ